MWKLVVTSLVVVGLIVGTVACSGEQSVQGKDKETQEDVLRRAQITVPAYDTQNFLAREGINKYMERLDVPDKLWYVYLLNDVGIFAYHIVDSYPLSIGVGITNPNQRIVSSYGNVVMPAPGIDGVFWAGADARVHYAFDAMTGAMIQWNTDYILYDYPLDVDVPLLRIKLE